MEFKNRMILLLIAAVSLAFSFKVKLGTDGFIDQETGMMEITMENQME